MSERATDRHCETCIFSAIMCAETCYNRARHSDDPGDRRAVERAWQRLAAVWSRDYLETR